MMKTVKVLMILGLALTVCTMAMAADTKRTASISDLKGKVEVRRMQDKDWSQAKVGTVLNQGDMLRTVGDSWALLNVDGYAQTATVEVKAGSQLAMAQLLENKQMSSQTTLLDLALGEVLIKAKKLHSEKSKFEVKTPTSIVAVRGTTFSVSVKTVE
jgi:hypothetical protein